MGARQKIAELENRTRRSALKCHSLFAERVRLGEPSSRFRRFAGPVVTNEVLHYQPDVFEVVRDPDGRSGSWGIELLCRREITTQAVLYPLRSKDVFVDGDQTARTQIDLRVFDYSGQDVLDPFVKLEPLGAARALDLVEMRPVADEHTIGVDLPSGVTDPATLERLYAAQRFCLQWLSCVGLQIS